MNWVSPYELKASPKVPEASKRVQRVKFLSKTSKMLRKDFLQVIFSKVETEQEEAKVTAR